MEGILFVVNPVWWVINPMIGYSLIIALIGGIFVGYSIVYKLQRKTQVLENNIQEYSFQSVDPTDSQYAAKTLGTIRRYLTEAYYPMHSWAHIPMDIRSYTTDIELIAIIEQLEEIEFSGKTPDKQILELINNNLIRKLSS